MSLAANSLTRESTDYTTCPQCGRQYPKQAHATRMQYFCSSCGTDLNQEEIKPLIPTLPKKAESHSKCMTLAATALLFITTLAVIYFVILNPSSSDSQSTPDAPLLLNTTSPSASPSIEPTMDPSPSPTVPTNVPTTVPTMEPSKYPTESPTTDPTIEPTRNPTISPSAFPTNEPTVDPTDDPTKEPTYSPTDPPTSDPSTDPTLEPTFHPTSDPTTEPTFQPTLYPTEEPTTEPTSDPTESMEMGQRMETGLTVGAVGIGVILVLVMAFFACKYRERMGQNRNRGAKSGMDGNESLIGNAESEGTATSVVMA